MAWEEGQTLKMEQGLDFQVTFELFTGSGFTQPWPFPSWDVNAVLSDALVRINPITIGAKNLPEFRDIATIPLNVPRK